MSRITTASAGSVRHSKRCREPGSLWRLVSPWSRTRLPRGNIFNYWTLGSDTPNLFQVFRSVHLRMAPSVKRFILIIHFALCSYAQRESYELLTRYSEEYPLPHLPFAYDELEPYLDTPTLKIHHQGHHKGYADKMNAALKQWREQVSTAQADCVEVDIVFDCSQFTQ